MNKKATITPIISPYGYAMRTIAEHEVYWKTEGYTTERVAFHRGSEKFFVMIVKHPDILTRWNLFTADGTEKMLCATMDGTYSSYLGRLAELGFYPDTETGEERPEKPLPKIRLNGFKSIAEYERECIRAGHSTRRVPFIREGADKKYFVLISSPPKTDTSIESWRLFTADETLELMDGIISGGKMDPSTYIIDGVDVNYLGKLAAFGFYPDTPADLTDAPTYAVEPVHSPAPSVEDHTDYDIDENGQCCFLF